MPAIILLNSLSKHFKVPVRESGLKASLGSLFKREFRTVKAVDEITFQIDQGEVAGGTHLHHPSGFRRHYPGRSPHFPLDPPHPGRHICTDLVLHHPGAFHLAPGTEKLLRGIRIK